MAFLLPKGGGNEWDRPGADLHDAEGLAAFCYEVEAKCPANVDLNVLECHINDAEFSNRALEVFDSWVADGTVNSGVFN